MSTPSVSHFASQTNKLGVGKKLGGDTAGGEGKEEKKAEKPEMPAVKE